MKPLLSIVDYHFLGLSKLEIGAGWYYVLLGTSNGTGENQQLLKSSAVRAVFEMWCHENAKGKWCIDDNGVLFMDEQDAILLKMASPH